MQVLAINGSPRTRWNSAQILASALDGARSAGAETEMIHLYTQKYSGCRSCFACKKIGGPSYGRCALEDDLRAVLDKALAADALLIASPVYFGDITSGLRAFLERLWFPGFVYDKQGSILYHKRIPVKFFLTMNLAEQGVYQPLLARIAQTLELVIGPVEGMEVRDTLQFDDYSQYVSDRFDEAAKRRRHEEVFPQDCRQAARLGQQAVKQAQLLRR